MSPTCSSVEGKKTYYNLQSWCHTSNLESIALMEDSRELPSCQSQLSLKMAAVQYGRHTASADMLVGELLWLPSVSTPTSL